MCELCEAIKSLKPGESIPNILGDIVTGEAAPIAALEISQEARDFFERLMDE